MVMPALPEESILDMFLGNCPGSIGEISALALLIGLGYLLYRRVISIRIPAAYILTKRQSFAQLHAFRRMPTAPLPTSLTLGHPPQRGGL